MTPVLSLVLPFIKIETFKASTSQIYVTRIERVLTQSSQSLEIIGTTGSEQHPTNWWLIVYLIGAGISFLLLILKLYKLKILKSVSFHAHLDNKKISILPNSKQAFSFWNTIYLGDTLDEDEKKQILVHELVHVEQKHSLDQLLFEILKILFWWNPLVYNYQSRITVLHEYIADAVVITTIDKRNYIDQLLNAAFQTQEITFVNQFFNQSLIKKRIIMLQKTKSKTISKFKYLFLIPVIAGILVYTSCSDDSNESENSLKNETTVATQEKTITQNDVETACLNKNASYDFNLDNYLRIENGKNTEAILNIVNVDTEKIVRSAHFVRSQMYYLRNIPEGKYRLDFVYGEDYVEETVNGVCTGFFKNLNITEIGEDILDFNTTTSTEGKNVPSYSLELDLIPSTSSDDQEEQQNYDINTNSDDIEENSSLSACLKEKAIYDSTIDNYMKLEIADNTEVIVELISVENSQSVRTVHLKENTKTVLKNIPEGKYKVHIQYGESYEEVTTNGMCKVRFKNQIASEIEDHVLDFYVTKTPDGKNVPSYSLTLDIAEVN
ncbi:hypothetical protein GCM10022393_36800 [Aquimarina addita]|uniref:Peptidase M56 domain-containing protein n=2 Tax=Aquimarina addita TaxID=870485 RepID=A0ABP6UUF2_9FLAO